MTHDSHYALVIPIADTDPRCKDLLETLLTSISYGYYNCPVVCLFDNCSKDFVDFFEQKYTFITSMPHWGPTNLNFAKNSNRGLRYVYQELHLGAFLVNMDVCLPHRGYLEKICNNGISSPRAMHIDGDIHQKTYKLNNMSDPGCPCNKDRPVEVANSIKFAAFCMWISKYAFSKIGFLDDNTFVSSFEDDDYCVRACLANLPCEQNNGIAVHHELDNRESQISTTNSYDMNTLMDHMERFRKKWEIPPHVGHNDFNKFVLKTRIWEDKWKIN